MKPGKSCNRISRALNQHIHVIMASNLIFIYESRESYAWRPFNTAISRTETYTRLHSNQSCKFLSINYFVVFLKTPYRRHSVREPTITWIAGCLHICAIHHKIENNTFARRTLGFSSTYMLNRHVYSSKHTHQDTCTLHTRTQWHQLYAQLCA